MMRKKQTRLVPPPSGLALAELLEKGGPRADAIKARVHRTMLWRYTTGRGAPDAETIAWLHEVSDGRVGATGWVRLKRAANA